jgi:hypothetical protein
MSTAKEPSTLFRIWDTPVKVKPAVLANLLVLCGFLSWQAGRRRPERPWAVRLLVGMSSLLALLAADLGHAVAHILSARYAQAPMDHILVSAEMPRTIYPDHDVPPRVHRLRALGGPIFSALSLLASLFLRRLAPRGSLGRELADWSCLGHGLILGGSLAPLPFVDGGSILKWTLVERGQTPQQADAAIRQVDLAFGAAATATGLTLAARRRWLPALGLVAGGAIAVAAVLDRSH